MEDIAMNLKPNFGQLNAAWLQLQVMRIVETMLASVGGEGGSKQCFLVVPYNGPKVIFGYMNKR